MGVNKVDLLNGENIIDLTGDTLIDPYDLYNGITAHSSNGEPITGLYKAVNVQLNSGSANCSSSQLIIPCEFEPYGFCIILNSGTFTNNVVTSVWCIFGGVNAIQYFTKISSSPYLARTVYTNALSTYAYYDLSNKRIVVKKPTNSYAWGTNNYRVLIFK